MHHLQIPNTDPKPEPLPSSELPESDDDENYGESDDDNEDDDFEEC